MLFKKEVIGVQASDSVVEPVWTFTCFVLTDCVVGLVEIRFLLSPIIVCSIGELIRHSKCKWCRWPCCQEGSHLKFKPQNRLLSQFRASTCFVLADCVVGLIEIEFLLLTIISVTSENSSGIAIANGVDGNAVRKEVIGVQTSDSVVEPVTCIHLLCTRRLRRWPC